MNYLGKIEEITTDGRLIVECEDLPDIGNQVFDNKDRKIGRVGRVFGPVDAPYASIDVDKESKRPTIGTELFFKGRDKNGKGKRRNRRD